MKSAADQLAERYLLGEDTFVRYAKKEEYLADGDDEVIQVGLFELIDAFQKILRNVSPDLALDFSAEKMSVKDKISQLVDILDSRGSVTFSELFLDTYDKGDIVVTFLAILEMVKLSLIQITQHLQSGIIRIFYL
jgi:segregation and condensation protein A